MNTQKRFALILTVVIGSSIASPALAKDAVVKQTQDALNFLCQVSTLFDLPTTACDVKEAIANATKVADSVKSTIESIRKNTVPQVLQSVLKPITGQNAELTDSVRDTIAETFAQGDIADLQNGIGEINQQLDQLFATRADATSQALGSQKSASPGASDAANASAAQISGNGGTQSLALGSLADQTALSKEIVNTLANGEASQRIAQSMSDDKSGMQLLETARDASQKSVQRAQTAVSSRAALQVVGEQLGFMMEQSASQHLHLTKFLASQAQNSALSTQQLTTIARLELEKRQSASAGAAEDFKQLITEAQQYPTYVEDTLKGWEKTLIAAGNPTSAPALSNSPAP